MKNYLFVSRVLLCMVLVCTAVSLSCRQEEPSGPDANEATPDFSETLIEPHLGEVNLVEPNLPVKVPTGADGTEVAVTINGADITEGQIDTQIDLLLERIRAQGKQLPPQFVEQYRKQARLKVLEGLVVEQLLEEKVKAAGIGVTEDEVTERIKEMAAQQEPPLSLEDLKALMEAHGQSLDELKARLQKELVYQKLIESESPGEVKVTDQDARKYYTENKNRFEVPEQLRASHILIKPNTTDPNTDPNEAKATAKAKTQDLLKQIKDGADFGELAKEHSECPSAAKGGDLGYFPKDRMVPPFEKAAFELEVGQISDVVETAFGYHIIKLTDRKEPEVRTFEQAKDDIVKMLTRQQQAERAKKYVESLKASAKIVYPPGKEPWANRRF